MLPLRFLWVIAWLLSVVNEHQIAGREHRRGYIAQWLDRLTANQLVPALRALRYRNVWLCKFQGLNLCREAAN